jgi:hypothetical protein
MSRIARAYNRRTHKHFITPRNAHIALTYPDLPRTITTLNVSTNQDRLHAVPTRRARLVHYGLPPRKFQRAM